MTYQQSTIDNQIIDLADTICLIQIYLARIGETLKGQRMQTYLAKVGVKQFSDLDADQLDQLAEQLQSIDKNTDLDQIRNNLEQHYNPSIIPVGINTY